MKLSILPLAVVSTGLLASASPMRVVIVSSGVQTIDRPVAQMEPPVFRLRPPPVEAATGGVNQQTSPCGSRVRQKVKSISNAFKIALGFSVSDKKEGHGHWHLESKLVQPLPFIGTPNANGLEALEGETQGGDRLHILPISAHPHPERIHAHRIHKSGKHSFLMRVHFALMSLGPWEGRAVAFVLGCGIGVLLRMVWVMAVISYRMIRGQRPEFEQEEHEYTVVDIDAEEIFVAPPLYTYPVEKEAVAAESN